MFNTHLKYTQQDDLVLNQAYLKRSQKHRYTSEIWENLFYANRYTYVPKR